MTGSEDEKRRLLEGNLGFETRLEDDLLKRVCGGDGEAVRSRLRVTVGKGGFEEELGK